MRIAIIALVLAVPSIAAAKCDIYGNCYQEYKIGDTTYQTGIGKSGTWQGQYDQRGARGIDSRGNSWSYDRETGYYQNSNGKVCTGKGYMRQCWGN